MDFSIIVAADLKNGIGKNGKIPWHLPSDLKFFSRITRGNGKNVVIMGRTTWDSLPPKHRPLPDRKNIVLTRNTNLLLPEGVYRASSLEESLQTAEQMNPEKIFVIGGANVFAQSICLPACGEIFLTRVKGDFNCDTFFPSIDEKKFKKIEIAPPSEDNGLQYQFFKYEKQPARIDACNA